MRIVRLKVKPDVALLIKDAAVLNGFDDPGFVEDVYSLLQLNGQGLPDAKRIEAMAANVAKKHDKSKMGLQLIMSKRKQVLQKLVALPYFKALSKSKNLVDSVSRLLRSFQTLYRKSRQAQCMACALRVKCAFGQQYGEVMKDITKVIDPNFSTKVHEDCPHLPEIGAINQLGAAVQTMQAMTSAAQAPFAQAASKSGPGAITDLEGADPDDDTEPEDTSMHDTDPDSVDDNYLPFTSGVPGKGNSVYNNAHTNQHICTVTEQVIANVTAAQLLLYELGCNFDLALDGADAKSFKPVVEVEHDQKQERMKTMKDLTSLVSSQHGLPEEVFDARADKKQLTKISYQKPEGKKQLLYILIDSSGSMASALGNGMSRQPSLYTRAALATVFSLALVRKLRRDGGIIYLRFFEGGPSHLMTAKEPAEFDTMYGLINANNYNGWSTDIERALVVAFNDIINANATENLHKAEVLLITDCDDSVNVASLKQLIDKREVNVLDVGGGQKAENPQLRSIATKYMKVNEAAPDIKNMVKLL